MLQKFILLIPASCHCMRIDGNFGDVVIKKMDGNLEIRAAHGDKNRPYNLSVYSITRGQKVIIRNKTLRLQSINLSIFAAAVSKILVNIHPQISLIFKMECDMIFDWLNNFN